MIYCVDLDGRRIKKEMTVTSFFACIKRNPGLLVLCLFWYIKGKRPLLKEELANRYAFDPGKLPYNHKLLEWLKELKQDPSNKLYLVSGSSQSVVDIISSYIGLFDNAYGSNGIVNLTGNNKLTFIKETFGDTNNICYIGNAQVDFKVWEGVKYAVVVSNNERFIAKAQTTAVVLKVFENSFKLSKLEQIVVKTIGVFKYLFMS